MSAAGAGAGAACGPAVARQQDLKPGQDGREADHKEADAAVDSVTGSYTIELLTTDLAAFLDRFAAQAS